MLTNYLIYFLDNLKYFYGVVPVRIINCHPSFIQGQVWAFRVGCIVLGCATLEKDTIFKYNDTLIEFDPKIKAECDMNFQGGLSHPMFGIRYGSNVLKTYLHPENPVKANTVYNFVFCVTVN